MLNNSPATVKKVALIISFLLLLIVVKNWVDTNNTYKAYGAILSKWGQDCKKAEPAFEYIIKQSAACRDSYKFCPSKKICMPSSSCSSIFFKCFDNQRVYFVEFSDDNKTIVVDVTDTLLNIKR